MTVRKRFIIGITITLSLFLIIGLLISRSSSAPTVGPLKSALVSSSSAPSTPGPLVCGNTALLTGPSTAPAGAVTLAAGSNTATSATYELAANTTYYLSPGVHTLASGQYGQFEPDAGDTFIGAPGAIVNGEGANQYAFVSSAANVTIEYLTIENFTGGEGISVVNGTGSSNWTIENNTIENNDGAAAGLGSNSITTNNCLTGNQEYGFSSFAMSSGISLTNNEISDNDAAGTYDQPGGIQCGCSGGGKIWVSSNVTITGNYIHNNGNVGVWVDTENSGVNISNNYIANNWGEGITYELSYNGNITNNTLVGNAIGAGEAQVNGAGPYAAIYLSESGADSRVVSSYNSTFDITGNVLINNFSGVVLWENPNRFCGNTNDGDNPIYCTLIDPPSFTTYTSTTCAANLPTASASGNPDYFDNCRWKTQNVLVSGNTFEFTASAIGSGCTAAVDCGFNGLFSDAGSTPPGFSADPYAGWVVPNNISNHQNDVFSNNTYCGAWNFMGFVEFENLTQAQWTGGTTNVDSSGDPFGAQDAGSTFATSCSTPPPTTTTTVPVTTTTIAPTTTTTTKPPPPPTTTTTVPTVTCTGPYSAAKFTLTCTVS